MVVAVDHGSEDIETCRALQQEEWEVLQVRSSPPHLPSDTNPVCSFLISRYIPITYRKAPPDVQSKWRYP